MKILRLTGITFLLGAVASCTAYGQPQGYGSPPNSAPAYNQDYNQNYDRGYYDQGGPQLDVGFFYGELSPYGDWVRTPGYGWAWFPRNVPPYWRPYNDGRWMYTDYGWTWDSYEPFGWATYHYGRWAHDPRFGWLWIPGTVWGPAWVSWQNGGGYVGWAPLPPSVGFEIGVGLRLGGFNLSIGIRPDAYNFVPERSFLEPRLTGYLIPNARNVTVIHNTTNITNYTYIDNRVVNRGIDTSRIEKATGRRLKSYRVSEASVKSRSQISGEELRIYRPKRQQLDSVRNGKNANAGIREESSAQGRDKGPATTERRESPPMIVAPRVRSAPRPDARQIDQQNRREQEQLQRYQATEQLRVEKAQQHELGKAKVKSDRAEVEQRHQNERQALRQEQEDSSQQLKARQGAKRQAVVESQPPPATGQKNGKKVADPTKQEKNKQQKDSGNGTDKQNEAPPPTRI